MQAFVTRPIPEPGMKILWDALGKERVGGNPEDKAISREALLTEISGVSGLLCHLSDRIDGEIMDAAGGALRVIANFAVGHDNIDVRAARERSIWVTNTPNVLTEATADLAWALLMGAARRTGEGERFLRAGTWEGWGPRQYLGCSVSGRTLGIFGMGRIGQAVARRAKGFKMRVLYCNRTRLSPDLEDHLNASFVDKERLLRESDFLSIHCPLSKETHHAFGIQEFRSMKRTAVLINTSRGAVINEAELCQALESEQIFAAGLDVYEQEPHVCEGLLHQQRVLLLPHLGSATVETRNAMACMAATNIVQALQGKEPANPVMLAEPND